MSKVAWEFWDGRPLEGECVAFDTETAVEQLRHPDGSLQWKKPRRLTDPATRKSLRDPVTGKVLYSDPAPVLRPLTEYVPQLALASASDGGRHVVLRPDQLPDFILAHSGKTWVGHNIGGFDFLVVDGYLHSIEDYGSDGVPVFSALAAWWRLADEGRIKDLMLVDKLIRLAKGEGEHGGGGGDLFNRNLEKLANAYGVPIKPDKSNPYRIRFGELIGADWGKVDPGFFEYAINDAVATRQLFTILWEEANALADKYAPPPGAKRFSVFPGAKEKWGPLTESLQVKAAIALHKVSLNGVAVDLDSAWRLEARYRTDYAALPGWFDMHHPGLLKKDAKKGRGYLLTDKSGLPKTDTKRLRVILQDVAQDIGVEPPVSKGKQARMSLSAKDWADYKGLHPFLAKWIGAAELNTALKFFDYIHKLGDKDRLHCTYDALLRTGRAAAKRPALQQCPRSKAFRALFVARPGHKLVICDYSFIELRVLAAVCIALFGGSRMAEVIRSGVDLHSYTASFFCDGTYEEIVEAVADESHPKHKLYKGYRQSSKAVAFGVGGGLGAKKLAAYARANYKADLSEKEAGVFRERLITEIYPELNASTGYLKSTPLKDLCRNLGVEEGKAFRFWSQASARAGKRHYYLKELGKLFYVLEKVTQGFPQWPSGDEYAQEMQDAVWSALHEFVGTHRTSLEPDYLDLVRGKSGCPLLSRRLFGGVACTLTGRVRAGIGYTEQKNGPFQALAADGMKQAMWELTKRSRRVVLSVHDELVVEYPQEAPDADCLGEVKSVMESAMSEVVGSLVPVGAEGSVSPCWKK